MSRSPGEIIKKNYFILFLSYCPCKFHHYGHAYGWGHSVSQTQSLVNHILVSFLVYSEWFPPSFNHGSHLPSCPQPPTLFLVPGFNQICQDVTLGHGSMFLPDLHGSRVNIDLLLKSIKALWLKLPP